MAVTYPIFRLRDLQIACEADGCRKWTVVQLMTVTAPGTWTAGGKFCKECGRRKLKKAERAAEEH
jgi:hypothetical protein